MQVREQRLRLGQFKILLPTFHVRSCVRAHGHGSVYQRWSVPMSIEQDLVVKVGSRRSFREVCFKVDPVFKSTMNTDKFSGHHEWKLNDRIKFEPSIYVDVMKIRRHTKPAMSMKFKTKRHGMYFVWNVTVFVVS
jgi:hypothetical protein